MCIAEFKLLEFSFQEDDIKEFKKIEKVLYSAQSSSLLEPPSKKLMANFTKIKSSFFPDSGLQIKNFSTKTLNNQGFTKIFTIAT